MNQDPNSKESIDNLPPAETNGNSDATPTNTPDHPDSTQSGNSVAPPATMTAENPTHTQVETQKAPPSKAMKIIAIVVLICILGLIAFGLWKSYQPKEVELQGRVEAETIHIATKVPSRIEEIYVHEGQKVHKNQELVRLYSPEVDAKKQQALASLQSALALQSTTDRGSQEENIASLYANWQSLKAQQELAHTTYTRGAHLFQEGVISRQRRDEMQAAAKSSAQMTEAAYQQYARAQRGSTPQQKSTADAQVDIANAAVAEANALEAETKLLSPVNGTISKIYAKPSELIAIGVPVASIILDDDISISLNVREDQYRSVYQAQSLQGYIPALDKTANFKIKHIDAEGEFATIKTTRQTGGYDIRSFKVHLVPEQAIPELKVGMSVLFKVKEAP
ncbi:MULTISPECIES: HlyD family secretion protein [Acinetobacter]|uniref:HlyD family efflux transporter periplasmic adaptor subunit n=1 Tax=Acinetobacter chengduensis TaxID=2420890 RepID=A0ABX9TZJ3_9GAMM|nr:MULTISPECIES: efflux RND transporter periplasmic adaptor subunit [Acinetobacter]MBI1451013.1 efflux RND transporter periplasmic adaptor subunit [Acinetobacter sp. FL51]RKG42436.1 HlyD family efflux transporter periplasmic adaptor subunit [Acinetobacter sp. WCHAc060007]RLL24099.1 HlyD family efflux transporter periplasmic adaptor subunit [Acinetobacter chengduensis]